MIPTVIINKLTVVHKKSDGIATASAPDVCKTPTPGGLTPLPYPNVAFSKDLVKGSRTVKTNSVPAALKDSEFATSYGDEPGTGGGIKSGVNKGKAKFTNYSMDVKIEGRNVARLSDPMSMNGNNSNDGTVAEVQGNLSAEDIDILCKIFCWCDSGKKGGDFIKKKYYPRRVDWVA
jgi:uncharacterized Zn-binding protein involved in type VI secretion